MNQTKNTNHFQIHIKNQQFHLNQNVQNKIKIYHLKIPHFNVINFNFLKKYRNQLQKLIDNNMHYNNNLQGYKIFKNMLYNLKNKIKINLISFKHLKLLLINSNKPSHIILSLQNNFKQYFILYPQDKQQVLKTLQQKSNQYNNLLQIYMKQKNQIAQRLNYLNQLQCQLIGKQKKIKQQQFYLKKSLQQFQQNKVKFQQIQSKLTEYQQNKKKQSKPFHTSSKIKIFANIKNQFDQNGDYRQTVIDKTNQQILSHALKKIINHHNKQIYDVSFNYNGNLVATCGGDRTIKLYDIANMKTGITIETNHMESNFYLCVNLDYTGQKLLTGSTDYTVQIFSSSTGKQLHRFLGHGYKVNGVSWCSSKQKCISGSQDKQIKIWDIQKGTNSMSITCGKPVRVVQSSTIQPIIYSGHSDGSVRVYSFSQTNTPIAQIKGIIDCPINSVTVLRNRYQLLVSSSQGQQIYLFDLKMNKTLHKYSHKTFFNSSVKAQISPSQKYIISGNNDGYIYYWNKDKQDMQKKISGHQCKITTIKCHAINDLLATCDHQGNMILWQ